MGLFKSAPKNSHYLVKCRSCGGSGKVHFSEAIGEMYDKVGNMVAYASKNKTTTCMSCGGAGKHRQ